MTYKITPHTLEQAKIHGVSVKKSSNKTKKIDVIKNNEVIARIGAVGYSDYGTYKKTDGIEYANKRRELYKMRHKKDANVKNSNGYWANVLLW